MTVPTEAALTARRWRTRRSAAVAGIVFAVLLITALVILRSAVADEGLADLAGDSDRRRLIRLGLAIVPFAGIAFLWFIGVVRDQVGAVEDRLFSTVFLGSGILFLAMLFLAAVLAASLELLAGSASSAAPASTAQASDAVWTFGRHATRVLVAVYAMRMAAVFTLAVSTLIVRTGAVPRWVALLGYAEALGLLLFAGTNNWVQLAFPVWVLVLSLTILVVPSGPPPGR